MYSNILINHLIHVVKKMYAAKFNVVLVVISDKKSQDFFSFDSIYLFFDHTI